MEHQDAKSKVGKRRVCSQARFARAVFVCTSQAGGVGWAMGKRAFAGSDTKPSASTEEAAKIKKNYRNLYMQKSFRDLYDDIIPEGICTMNCPEGFVR